MNILGINAVFHESSAALVADGEVVAACEEERVNRIAGGAGEARVDDPHVLPEHAICYCLDHAGMRAVAKSIAWGTRSIQRFAAPSFAPSGGLTAGWRRNSSDGSVIAGAAVDKVLGRKLGRAFRFVPHHLAHAASAYYPSGFDSAAILIIDGIGEAACSTLARGDGRRIKTIEAFSYPHSLGFLWEQASIYLGFSMYDAAKVMGLAAYGDPDVFRRAFAKVVQVSEDSYAGTRPRLGFPSADPRGSKRRSSAARREPGIGDPSARTCTSRLPLQAATDAAVAALLRRLERSVGFDHLCVAGGVALNCVTNSLISQVSAYSTSSSRPRPMTAGPRSAQRLRFIVPKRSRNRPRAAPRPISVRNSTNARWWLPSRRPAWPPRRSKDAAREAADMIADGNIVGWFQGRMEFRPVRARQSVAARRPAAARYAGDPQSQDQAPRGFSPLCAERPRRARGRMVRPRAAHREPRIHAVCLSDQGRAERAHSGRAPSRRDRPGAARPARVQSALS